MRYLAHRRVYVLTLIIWACGALSHPIINSTVNSGRAVWPNGTVTRSDAGGSPKVSTVDRPRSGVNESRKDVVLVMPTPRRQPNKDEIERWRNNERSKQTRLFIIQKEIMEQLGFKKPPKVGNLNVTIPPDPEVPGFSRCTERMKSSDSKPRKCYNLLPSCPLPKRISKSPELQNGFKLYFEIAPPDVDNAMEIKVTEANLQLKTTVPKTKSKSIKKQKHKTGLHKNFSTSLAPTMVPVYLNVTSVAPAQQTGMNSKRFNKLNKKQKRSEVHGQSAGLSVNDSNSLNVTVFALDRQKGSSLGVKKKMLKSTLVSRNFAGWVRINVKKQIQEWFHSHQKNLGFLVVVTDHEGHTVDPFQVFESYNCSLAKQSAAEQRLRANFNRLVSLDSKTSYPNLDFVTTLVSRKGRTRHSRQCH